MKAAKIGLAGLALVAFGFVGCSKNKCSECHYEDATGAEVELGEFCGDEREDMEANGHSDGTTTWEVHCGEHE
ncbi:MAG: hypothetical protein AB8B56_19260 [Crocinitomicaceae bacterium]